MRLGHVLSRAWYQQGLVTLPARLLREHPEVRPSSTPAVRDLAARIQGADRVIAHGIEVPPRASGPAYQPERGPRHVLRLLDPRLQLQRLLDPHQGGRRRPAPAPAPTSSSSAEPATRGTPRPTVASPRPAGTSSSSTASTTSTCPARTSARRPIDHYVLAVRRRVRPRGAAQPPSVIHAASNHRVGLAALIAARRLGLPFVYEVRGLWEITEASDKPGWEDTERFAEQVAARDPGRQRGRPRARHHRPDPRRARPPRGPCRADPRGAQRRRPGRVPPAADGHGVRREPPACAPTSRSSASPAAWSPTRGSTYSARRGRDPA